MQTASVVVVVLGRIVVLVVLVVGTGAVVEVVLLVVVLVVGGAVELVVLVVVTVVDVVVLVDVVVGGGGQGENSDVLPSGAIAVAVMNLPADTAWKSVTVNAASPPASVVTVSSKPTNSWPSPLPEGSQASFARSRPGRSCSAWS